MTRGDEECTGKATWVPNVDKVVVIKVQLTDIART